MRSPEDRLDTELATEVSASETLDFSELSFEELETREAPTFLMLSYEEEPRI